ncbi:MAG: HEAT repeat domain-containing protein [Phormidesmis sp.]
MSSAKNKTILFQTFETIQIGTAPLEAPLEKMPSEKEKEEKKVRKEKEAKQKEITREKRRPENQRTNHTDEEEQIALALSKLTSGDFHSKWDSAKQFIRQFRSDRPVPLLVQQLQDSADPEHQWFLVRILGQYNQPIVVETLARFLITTPETELQAEAIKALTQLGNSAISVLAQQLQSNELSQRRLAARTLGHIRRSAVIAPLLSIARDPDYQLREIAIEALGSFHDPRITPILISALTDESAIATEAIRALGRRADLLPEYNLTAALQHCLLNPDETVAKESAIALGRLGTEEAAVALGTLLTQPAPTAVKVSAVRALSWLDSTTATSHLIEAFECTPPIVMPVVKQEIAKALGQSRSQAHKVSAAKPLVQWLQQTCETANAATTSPSHTTANQTADQTANQTADQTATESTTGNATEEFALKQTVISALTWLGATEAIDSLIFLLTDDDLRIQMHALSALKQIDPRDARTSVMKYMKTPGLSQSVKDKISEHLFTWS